MSRDRDRRESHAPEPGRGAALREQLEHLAAQRAHLEAELAASEGRLPARNAAPAGPDAQGARTGDRPPGDMAPAPPHWGSLPEQRRWTGRTIRLAILALGLGVGLYYIDRLRESRPEARAAAAIEAAAEAEAEAAADAAEAAAEASAEAAAEQAAAQAEANARARANRVRPDGPRSGAPAPPP